jgi:adenosine deaminase
VLLGTKRIGHGFAVVKYPNILKIVKKMKIGIEVNPLSNQVLKLVDDLRNHPAAILFSDDYPVVISRFVAHNILQFFATKLIHLIVAMIHRSGVLFL